MAEMKGGSAVGKEVVGADAPIMPDQAADKSKDHLTFPLALIISAKVIKEQMTNRTRAIIFSLPA